MPIFYLSFMRLPVKVWKRLVRIQREFLWGDVGGGRKINWVSWKKVCQPKEEGGLGVRDIRLVNLSLLAKWRWRLIQQDGALWKEVLREKYGNNIGEVVTNGGGNWYRHTSRWWKDIMTIDDGNGMNWVNTELARKFNNGLDTYFWKSKWRGEVVLCNKYPRLFAISNQKEAKVGEIRVVSGNGLDWLFTWRRRLFVWEEGLLANLLLDLHGFVTSNGTDEWFWKLEDDGRFSVSSMYKKLDMVAGMGNDWGSEKKRVFSQVWKSPAPLKVVALFRRSLLNRIPTRLNLVQRHALLPNSSLRCVLCDLEEESTNHLFLHCNVACSVWEKVKVWFEIDFITPHNLFIHWLCWNAGMTANKVFQRGRRLVWHTTMWVIWRARNNCIFNNVVSSTKEIFDEIKVLSWRWSLYRIKILSCLFYEWCRNSRFCLRV